jgi:hypothetical protein
MFPFAIAVKNRTIRIILAADNSGLAKELSSLLNEWYVPSERRAGKFVTGTIFPTRAMNLRNEESP